MNNPYPTYPALNRPSHRSRYQGMLQVLQFNWPWYAAGLLVLLVSYTLLHYLRVSPVMKGTISFLPGCALCWTIASVLVSHWIYDRSGLTKWNWVIGCIPALSGRAASIHCGFDESIEDLRRIYPGTTIVAWDIYKPELMSEGSIARARHVQTAPTATRIDYSKLPESDDTLGAVFLIFAAHEIRSAKARDAFFKELFRILKPGGTVLLVEHLRDWRNFLAYGPGFFHFLGAKEWLRLAKDAGLGLVAQSRITPFVLVLKLSKPLTL
jgi:SAM-dependent methyltransferase